MCKTIGMRIAAREATHTATPRRGRIERAGVCLREAIRVIRKETCSNCKGNRYIAVTDSSGDNKHAKCPRCGGRGYRVRAGSPHSSSDR